MCGFSFLLDRRIPPPQAKQRMERSLQAMQHRGPDDGHIEVSGDTMLGHRRLSVIDLAGSRQPMSDPTGRYLLAYNGEIYNYVDVRNQLDGRWAFTTKGDTEVLLAGLVLQGASFLERLEGMWAFAFWDSQERCLLLGRDRMGKKPLFFQPLPEGGMTCASEIPSLRKLSDEPWHESLDSTADYLRYGYYLPGTTAYQDVCEVLPGHTLGWSPGKSIEAKAYWSLPLNPFQGTRKQAKFVLQEKMFAAVERRLVSDVEVGAFLSGGVDSSLIVSILVDQLNVSPKTFTIGFEEKSYDESMFADLVAKRFSTEHYVEYLKEWDSGVLEKLIFEHVGQPFSDPSILPTAMLSKLAASHVKVALSGDGGDELFSGYQRYQARVLLQWYTRLPILVRKNIRYVVESIPEPMVHHSHSLIKKAHLFLDTVDRQAGETSYIAPLMFSNEEFSGLAPDLIGRGHRPPKLPDETDLDDIYKMMASDALIYLPQDILQKVDRASMAYSLETRAPFLDSEVVKTAFSIPRQWHRRGMVGKRMLRETFSGFLPDNIWKRRKQGLGVPVGRWFRENLGRELEGLIEDVDMPLNKLWLKEMLVSHRENKRDQGLQLWMIYIYLLWKRNGMCIGAESQLANMISGK
ncbi:MAG: asparagine synthase (glutamine-hydrolyzing) [Gammaproteobacteria bacterium]|nr:asparagine synthase (glutamine-hydrolyzing) [Gammaproteobacteria bacterium]